MAGRLDLLNAAVERFLQKSYVHNYPLEQFRETEVYLNFEQVLYDAILAQGEWAADHLADAPTYPDEPNDIRVLLWEDAMKLWLTRLPPIGLQLDYDAVYQLLYDAFVYNCRAQLDQQGLLQKKARPGFTKAESSTQVPIRITDAGNSGGGDDSGNAGPAGSQDPIEFELTNQYYINALKDAAAYLLNTKSKSYDQTTKDRLVKLVRDARLERQTIDEVATLIHEQFPNISSVRSFMIANTETANAFGQANLAFMQENGIETKKWVPAGPSTCKFCLANAAQGFISTNERFTTGDLHVPAHPQCECYEEAGEIDLEAIDIWTGN